MTAGFRVREQKFICGKDYATADTMQVDFFEITEQQHKASTRKKKELASSIAKEAYNLRKSGRYLELLVQRNFHKSDYSVTYTYDDEHRPDPADTKRVDKDFSAAMKKLYRMCDKKGIRHPKWIVVHEYSTYVDGVWVGKHHHHVIMQRVYGLTREMVEEAWSGRGMARCEPLHFDHGYITSLAKYIMKNVRCKRHWRQSRGLTAENAPPERWENEPHQVERCLREPSGRSCILGEDVPRIHPALLRTHNHRQQHPAPDRAPISQRDWDAAEQEEPALSMRMELSDLPPKYRAQAEAQIAARCRAKAPTLEAVAAAAKKTGREFDSRGEYDYYMGMILPKVQRGEIVKVESHRRFTMLPEKEYGNVKLPAMHYTPDFVLTYADGTVEVVEVKSKFTRRQQRDYIHRRRMFIDLVAEPRGWRFVEHITPDTAAEIKAWKKCAQQTERKG